MDPYQILGLSKKFTLQELKDKYKTIAIKVHPDKGGTEELFLLVTKCYKQLLEEYNRRASQKEFHELKADFKKASSSSSKRPTPASGSSQNNGRFDLDKFNRVFSENKLKDAYDDGYKDWMTNEEAGDIPKPKGKFTLDGFNRRFEKSQVVDKNNKYIIRYQEPEPMMASKKIGFTELGQEQVGDFSGDNTTRKNLNYMDYKVAHTTSKIVDPALTKTIKTYKNVEELERHRGNISYQMDDETAAQYEARMKLEKVREHKRREALMRHDELASQQYERVNMMMLGRRGG